MRRHMVAPRPDVSQQRKSEIIDAAARVFSRKGFGARMEDIVRESGLSKGLLYWYFKSKDAIIVSILDRMLGPELRGAQQLAESTGSARRRLLDLAERTIKEIEVMQRFMAITYEFYSLAFRHRVVRKAISGFFAAFIESIQCVIQQGIDDGEFRTVDPRATAVSLIAAFEGSLLLWIFDPEIVQADTQLRLAVELFLDGIARRPAGSAVSRSAAGSRS
jgi:AcrR family transcriptional regulator